jgi:NAD(P)-dependent dehydrogenase (short-subunit alcohol dehydrogenase family)
MLTGLDSDRVRATVESLGTETGDGGRVAGLAVDVRDSAAVDRLVAETVERFGGVDTLVNNAGVGVFGEVGDMTDEAWRRVIDTNLSGACFCSRAVLPELRRSGGGWIINMASLAGRNFFPGGAAYCASKAALIAFSEALMQEVRFDNIRVSVVMPGSVATDFSGPASSDDSWKLSTDDVAAVVADLLRHADRSLPSKVEIRPARPRK